MDETALRVKAAVIGKHTVVFYLEDGNTITKKNNDPRLSKLIADIQPINSRGEVAVVSLEDFSAFAAFEEKSNGLVRFFRIAKDKVKNIFSSPAQREEDYIKAQKALEEAERAFAVERQIAEQEAAKLQQQVRARTDLTHVHRAVTPALLPVVPPEDVHKTITPEEVIATAEPVKAGTKMVDPDSSKEDHTIVAIVGDTVIPGMENLERYFTHSTMTSAEGIQKFLARLAGVIKMRGHSVEDVLRFMQRGDLPVANDGCILAYKSLYRQGNGYVDCHTKSVKQRVGSFVCIPETLVDKDRRNECSSGLHIGRRAYMGSFSGDVMVLCKVAPEDVVTVPHGDPNKVRVMGYHIIGELSPSARSEIMNNRHMTDVAEARKLLAAAMAGDHTPIIERVQINGHRGSNVVITPVHDPKATKADAVNLDHATALDSNILTAVDPKAIIAKQREEAQQAEEILALSEDDKEAVEQFHDEVAGRHQGEEAEKALIQEEKPIETPADKIASPIVSHVALALNPICTPAEKLENAKAALAIKKKAKKGWEKLGISLADSVCIIGIIEGVVPEAPAEEPVVAPVEEKQETVFATSDEVPVELETRAQKIERLNAAFVSTKDKEEAKRLAAELQAIKKAAKKSYEVLGIHPLVKDFKTS